MVLDKRADVIARYQALREINVRFQGDALALVSKSALLGQAKRLGLLFGNTIVAGDETEMTYIWDLCLYTAMPGRKRAIDRYARTLQAASGSDEKRVMEAMCAATFSFWRIERKHEIAGVIVQDLVREEEVWLMDLGLEASAPIGLTMGSRLIEVGPFAMTCGVSVGVDRALIEATFNACACLEGRRSEAALVEDRRFAAALYRLSVEEARLDDEVDDWAA